ncbi:hypothetical protein PGT21_002850 [Puccinia graminis f. sp. tritici]|uniref:TM7S3/TM198-like domain-containing protein n=1 Tax=Puccinia graminis f. sp. tritici TaxID=56615 RepID=A0A5B0N7Q9_PUCGR|nr:hypothetical protein PGT21_002850 [Puccinia graminis f. sp. tritici]KAA1128055.1 hypothetical protein PGTUg99_017020 [Puccinia graminis f. sp. tritici]
MSTTDEPIDNLDPDSSSRPSGPTPGQADISFLGLDGSLPSIRSASLILQALIPLLISLVLLLGGRRLYRFTTTVSVGLTSALFTWALCVNLEYGQSIGGWTGEVAALTVWSVMIGGGLVGAIIGYQYTWWGAHVTGRMCLGANSGVGFAFSILLFKAGLLIHTPAGQWSLVAAFAIIGVLAVLCDHVIGPLLAVSLSGSFLFLLAVDLFATLGIGGVASGLRLLIDHNPDHQMLLTPYTPSKSTEILIIVSWVIAAMSFGLQYFFYDTPFGPVPPTEVHDEEERLGFGAGKSKESFSQGSSDDAKKEVIKPEVSSHPTEQHQTINISNPRPSNVVSIGTKTSATLVDSNRAAEMQEPSNLPYVAPRAGPVVAGEYGSAPALALSPTVYSRYRRTLDTEHKPPGRSPIQYNVSSLNTFTNPRRVETVDEVTETSTSVRGGDLTARSSMLTIGGISDKRVRSNSMSEEYLQAMMRLAAGEGADNQAKRGDPKQGASGTVPSMSASTSQENQAAAVQDPQSANLLPITEPEVLAGHSSPEVGQAKPSIELSPPEVVIATSSAPISSPAIPASTTDATKSTPVVCQTETPTAESANPPVSSNNQEQPNIEPKKTSRPLSKWPSCSSFGHVILKSSRGSEDAEKEDGRNVAPRTARARRPGLSPAEFSRSDSNSRTSRELGAEAQAGSLDSRSQERNGEPASSEQLAPTSENGSAIIMRRYSHRPLPLLPRGNERRSTQDDQRMLSSSPLGNQFRDTGSLNSATSNVSSALDSFTRVDRDSSVPTTPSWSGNILKDDRKEEVASSSGASSRKKLSIIVTKNPVQVERGSMSSPTSQEAERDNYSDLSNSAVPHTPTLGNMLLRVADNTARARRQANNSNQESLDNQQAMPSEHSRDDDGDGETVRSEASRRSTVCMSSAYGHTDTSADEGGRSSSESEYEDEEQSQEMYFNPGRFQQLDQAMGEWGKMVGEPVSSDAETEGKGGGRSQEPSPSLQSIPLPSRESSSYMTQSSSRTTLMGPTPFVGQPLAEVPWPQKRPNQPIEKSAQEKEKRWTSASSIFPPWSYESSAETPRPGGSANETDAHSSSESGTNQPGSSKLNKATNGSVTSCEEDANRARGMFCSASSHVADDYDVSSVSHVDETDAEDPYESAADYSRSLRASLAGAPDGGYMTADD